MPTPRRTPIVPPVAVAAMGIVLTVGLPLAGTLSPGHALEVAMVVVAVSALVAMAVSCIVHRRRVVELVGRLADSPPAPDGPTAREVALAESRRQLVAWITDDLRTPLASLRTTAEALEDGVIDDPDHVASALASIRTEADRLSDLLTDLYELAHVPAAGDLETAVPSGSDALLMDDVRLRAARAVANGVPLRTAAGERDQSRFDMAFRVDAAPADAGPVMGPGS